MIHVSEVATWDSAAVLDLARMAVLSDEPVIYHASVELTAEQIAAVEQAKAEVRGRLLIDSIADRLGRMATGMSGTGRRKEVACRIVCH